MIDLFKPNITEAEAEAVKQVLLSGWLGQGPQTKIFENRFATYVNTKYAVSVNSCTSALQLAIKLLNIGPGDEVLVPTITFVSTAHAVIQQGAIPIFCDIDPNTLLLDIESAKKKITKRTKAVIPVHYSGRVIDARVLGIPVIEDCAHACGSIYQGQKAGSIGDIGCFSFQAVKNLCTGDGGMLTFNNEEYYKQAKKLRWLGIDKGTWDRTKGDLSYVWEYNVEEIGYKFQMNDIVATIGLGQLARLDTMNQRRKNIQQLYREGLSKFSQIALPPCDTDESLSSWHIFCVQAEERDNLITYLRDRNIATGVHYKPIHLYDCYGKQPTLPVAEVIWKKILSLPMHFSLSDNEVERVIRTIGEYYGCL